MQKRLAATRVFNQLRVDRPDDLDVVRGLQSELCVARKIVTRNGRGFSHEYMHEPCYTVVDPSNTGAIYITGYGFLERIQGICKSNGFELVTFDDAPADAEDAIRLVPDVSLLQKLPLRDSQRDILRDIICNSNGQYVAPTGGGKSYIIRHLCSIFPRARILITTYSNTILKELYETLVKESSVDAGIYCTRKRHNTEARVLFCSVGCLERFSDRPWDVLLLDEKHECATLDKMRLLLKIRCRRAYAMSANHNQRSDGADKWLVAAFGENRVRSGHLDAVKAGDIVPVEVLWQITPYSKRLSMLDISNPYFDRYAIWDNELRNGAIAEVAERFAKEGQTLVYVRTIEHIYKLRQLLHCDVVHSAMTEDRWDILVRQGLVSKSEANPSVETLDRLKEQFANGDINLIIANSVWKRGVNFPELRTLIRGDASSTDIDATQISGRLTRKSDGKTKGVVVDFRDNFNRSMYGRARKRYAAYSQLGYKQTGW